MTTLQRTRVPDGRAAKIRSRLPTAARVTGYSLAAALALVPLVITPGASFYFDITPKIVILAAAAAALLLAWPGWLPGLREFASRRFGQLFLALVAAHVLSLCVSTWFSTQPGLSYAGANWRRMGLATEISLVVVLIAFIGWLRWNPSRLSRLLVVVCAAGAISGLYGIFQYFGIDPFLPTSTYHVGQGEHQIVRPPGTIGRAGYFSTYLLHPAFLSGALFLAVTDRRLRAFAIATGSVTGIAIVLSGTRSALVGLAVGILFVWWWFRTPLNRFVAATAVVSILAGVAFYVSPAGQKMRSRMEWFLDDPFGGGRIDVWRDSFHMASRHWVAGTGLESFSAAYPRYQSATLAAEFPDRYYESPHNVFIDALASRGLPGLLLLFFFVLLALEAARRMRPQNEAAGWIAGSLVASFASNQFVPFLAPTALYFYVTVALLLTLSMTESEYDSGGNILTIESPSRPRWPWWLAAPLALWLAAYAAQLAVSDRGLRQVSRQLADGDIGPALESYERVLAIQPSGMSNDLWFSRQLLASVGESESKQATIARQTALAAALRAADDSEERPNALYNLAVIYAEREEPKLVEESLRSAIQAAPAWYKPRWMLARVLWVTGRPIEAREEAAVAARLNGGHDPIVERTYRSMRDADASQAGKP